MEGSPCREGCQMQKKHLPTFKKTPSRPRPRLQQLLETVLEEEPWDAARHGKRTGKAWMRCGERVPGYLDTCGYRPGSFVQMNVVRTVRQLRSPKSITPRRWNPELRGKVEELAAKLEADPRHRAKVYLPDPANPKPPGWTSGWNFRTVVGRAEEPRLSQQQQELERGRGEAVLSQQQQGQQQGELSGKVGGL